MTVRNTQGMRGARAGSGVSELQARFGQIDIYLFDQLLKGRIAPGMRILDAGCGRGRNLVYFLQAGHDVYAADVDPAAIESIRELAEHLAPTVSSSNFRVERIENMSFADASVDLVISNAVFHFARDDADFDAMLRGAWRVLKSGGLFFCRLGSTIGMEHCVEQLRGRRYRSPDGVERYLVDEARLESAADQLGGELVEPLKTTVVQHQRAMTTWVLRKP